MSEVADKALLRASPGTALRGHVAVPGDKSISHRALILGALAEGETRIEGLLEGQDVLDTAGALRALGAQMTRLGEGTWLVRGGAWRTPEAPVDLGNSGTGARLLMGAAAGFPIEATFTGDASLRSRPMARVLEPLRHMGARTSEGNRLPVTIRGGGLTGISHHSPHASAQIKSAILLAGLHAKGVVEVVEPAKSRDHTEKMLAAFGCDVEVQGNVVRLGKNRRLTATDIMVPGDPSSAAFPLVAGLVVPGSEVTVYGVLMNPLRTGLFRTLLEMGADLSFANHRTVGGEEVADVTVLPCIGSIAQSALRPAACVARIRAGSRRAASAAPKRPIRTRRPGRLCGSSRSIRRSSASGSSAGPHFTPIVLAMPET